jgi:transposase
MSTDAAFSPAAATANTSALPTDAAELERLARQLLAREAEHQAREAQLTAALAESSQTVRQQQLLLDKLTHELALLKRWVFGARRERFAEDDPRQQKLFEVSDEPGAQTHDEAAGDEADSTAETRRRQRRGHGRKPLPQFLPRKTIEYTLPDSELGCPCCGERRQKISQVTSEQLEHTPASLFVIEHVQVTYACVKCQEQVVTAPKPPQPIEKGVAGPGLLAQVITAKYVQHLPLYRQEESFARQGVLIRRSTLAGWMAQAAECAWPLQQLMVRRVLSGDVVGTDDTPVKVLDPELDHARTGRFWTYVGDDAHRYTVYDYTASRKREGPQAFLKDYQGVLQADAFGGYDGIFLSSRGKIVEAACCAHARRKFFEVRETAPEIAHQALAYFHRLYAIEHDAAALSPEARRAMRQAQSVPVMNDMQAWFNEQLRGLRPKSPVSGAIRYSLKNWEALSRFTTDGNIPIDNNRSERTLRAQAVGRKNWLFLGSDNGGRTAAVLYSLVASAKRHHLDPQAYLTDVLRRLPAITNPLALRDLLPDRWAKSHPGHVVHFRRAESARAATRRMNRRERRRPRAQPRPP